MFDFATHRNGHTLNGQTDEAFAALLDYMRDSRGFDFTGYKRSLVRRVRHRMDAAGGRYVFRKDLHRAVIFGRNDLVKDAPISRVDLLVCRNSLMYRNADTQRNVLSRLHFALVPQGAWFLGHAEMLLSHSDRFTPIDLKNRISRKAAGSHNGFERFDNAVAMLDRKGDVSDLSPVRDMAFRTSPVFQMSPGRWTSSTMNGPTSMRECVSAPSDPLVPFSLSRRFVP